LESAVLGNDPHEFSNALQDEPTTARIPVLDLTGEVGGNDVKTDVLRIVDIIDGSGEVGRYTLLLTVLLWRTNMASARKCTRIHLYWRR